MYKGTGESGALVDFLLKDTDDIIPADLSITKINTRITTTEI